MIFAAGLGTRLRPLTDTMPKALVPLDSKPLLLYQIEKLKAAGITDIVINVHHLAGQIRRYLAVNDNFGCNIVLSDETDCLLDTGGGLKKAAPLLLQDNTPVLALNVDVLSNIDINSLVNVHQSSSFATVVVSSRDTQRYLLFDEALRLQGWRNTLSNQFKPQDKTSCLQKRLSDGKLRQLAFSGMHVLSPLALQMLLRNEEDKFSIIDFYLHYASSYPVLAFQPADYRMMDVGKIDHLREAEEFAKSLNHAKRI